MNIKFEQVIKKSALKLKEIIRNKKKTKKKQRKCLISESNKIKMNGVKNMYI